MATNPRLSACLVAIACCSLNVATLDATSPTIEDVYAHETIPETDIKDLTSIEIVQQISRTANNLSTASMNVLVLGGDITKDPQVSFHCEKTTWENALRSVCKTAHWVTVYSDDFVIVGPRVLVDRANASYRRHPMSWEAGQSVFIRRIEIGDVTLLEAIDFVRRKIHEVSAISQSVTCIGGKERPITFFGAGVQVDHLLRIFAAAAGKPPKQLFSISENTSR